MRPGYELVREQIFFRMELRERVHWFIKIRWAFVSLLRRHQALYPCRVSGDLRLALEPHRGSG